MCYPSFGKIFYLEIHVPVFRNIFIFIFIIALKKKCIHMQKRFLLKEIIIHGWNCRYFTQVRKKALQILIKAYRKGVQVGLFGQLGK